MCLREAESLEPLREVICVGFYSDSRFRDFALMVRKESDMEGAFSDKADIDLGPREDGLMRVYWLCRSSLRHLRCSRVICPDHHRRTDARIRIQTHPGGLDRTSRISPPENFARSITRGETNAYPVATPSSTRDAFIACMVRRYRFAMSKGWATRSRCALKTKTFCLSNT